MNCLMVVVDNHNTKQEHRKNVNNCANWPFVYVCLIMNNIFSFNLLHSSISTESSIVEFKSDEEKLKIEVSYFIARAGLRSVFAFIIVCILNHAVQVDIQLVLAWYKNSRQQTAINTCSCSSSCSFFIHFNLCLLDHFWHK